MVKPVFGVGRGSDSEHLGIEGSVEESDDVCCWDLY
jgi:hypothetical protein